MPSGLIYLNSLDQHVSNRKGGLLIIIITMFNRNHYN